MDRDTSDNIGGWGRNDAFCYYDDSDTEVDEDPLGEANYEFTSANSQDRNATDAPIRTSSTSGPNLTLSPRITTTLNYKRLGIDAKLSDSPLLGKSDTKPIESEENREDHRKLRRTSPLSPREGTKRGRTDKTPAEVEVLESIKLATVHKANLKPLKMKKPMSTYTRPLHLSDIDACLELESEATPEEMRASKEALIYRLTVCPELSLGIFTKVPVEPVTEACTEKCNQNAAPATSAQQASKNCDEEKKAIKDGMYDQHHSRLDFGRFWLLLPVVPREEILLGFVVATKMKGPFYSEDAAKIPTSSSEKGTSKSVDLASPTSSTIASALGHVEPGTTIALHSVSVRKSHQQQGLGTILLGDFKARMSTGGCADMISVAVPKSLSKFFNQFMFYDTCGRYSKDDRRIMNAPLLEKRQKGEFTLKDEF